MRGELNKICQVCEEEFTVIPYRRNKAKFCCRECFYKSREGIPFGCSVEKKGINKNCEICGKEFYVMMSKKCARFCSHDCAWVGRTGEKNAGWRGGKSYELYDLEFNEKLKREIRKRDGYRCQECFRHQDEFCYASGQKYKLYVHHIDYDKSNNSSINLISLCVNCHAKTNFKREDWERYFKERLGLSYKN